MHLINLHDEKPTTMNVLVRYIKFNLETEQIGQLVLFVGPPGGGKSWSALALCEAVDPTFKAEERTVFRSGDFSRLIKSGLPPGSAILFDEAGKDVGARSFMRRDQIALMVFIQAMRKLRYLVCFTVPQKNMADKTLRELGHIVCEHLDKNTSLGIVRFKVRYNSGKINFQTGEKIMPFFRVKSNGRMVKIRSLPFHKPTVINQHRYEALKDSNILFLADDIEKREAKEDKKEKKDLDLKPLMEKIMANIDECRGDHRRVTREMIGLFLDIPKQHKAVHLLYKMLKAGEIMNKETKKPDYVINWTAFDSKNNKKD